MRRPASALLLAGLGAASLSQARCGAPAPVTAAQVEELRPDHPSTDDPPPTFAPGDRVETFDAPGGRVRVHYARAGSNAVPADDANANMVPDFVELVGESYDSALALYETTLMLRVPVRDDRTDLSPLVRPPAGTTDDHGGDGRFDVYLVDFAGRADGAFRRDSCVRGGPSSAPPCSGYMLQENDFAGYGYDSIRDAVRTVASHELFHSVQSAYRGTDTIVFSEATATWATNRFDPLLRDLANLSSGYLDAPDRSLDQDPTGPPDGFSYGVGLFFSMLTQKHDDGVIRALLEARGERPDEPWLVQLDQVLRTRYSSSFERDFLQFAGWNVYTARDVSPERGWPYGADYQAVRRTPGTLPFTLPTVRLFRASARYYDLTTDGRASMRVRAVDAGPAVHGLVAVRRGGALDQVREVRLDGTEEVSLDGATRALFVLVNGASEGSSSRPTVCIGSSSEVDSCGATGPTTDDAGVQGDASVEPTTMPPMTTPAGCACSTRARGVPHEARQPWALAGLVVLTYAARRAARRRA